MEQEIQQLKSLIKELTQKVSFIESNYIKHQHDGIDGTNILRKNISLDTDQYLKVGNGTQATQPIKNLGLSSEEYTYSMSVGKDDGTNGFVNKADLLQLNMRHYPRNTSKQSFITAYRTPLVSPFSNTSISTTTGGNTLTISGFNFVTNELTDAVINIYNSSGSLVETQVISSNTSTEITIYGTWLATTTTSIFNIYSPVYLGDASTIWKRFYTQEGDDGGIRFGMGVTAGGQNGLLFMNATGDLYWRDKLGTSTKLN